MTSLYMYVCNHPGLYYRESLQGRLDHANKIIDDIMDSADRPLEVYYVMYIHVAIMLASCMYV